MQCEGLANVRLCSPRLDCPPAEHYQLRYVQPWLYARPCEEVLRLARQALTALRTAGRLPTLLHVGPKDLSNNRTKPFYEALFGNRSDCLQAVMVEANPDVATLLQQRLTEYFSPCPDRSVLTAALCSVDAEAASFFSLSEEVYTKYSVQELGGITTAASYGSLNLHFLLQDILDRTTGIQAEDLMPFIQERSVTCISPSSLLQLESLEPLDMLFLDTADGLGMLSAFLSLGVRPALLRFHWAWHLRQIADPGYAAKVAEAVAFLAAEGYHLYQYGEFFVAMRSEAVLPASVLDLHETSGNEVAIKVYKALKESHRGEDVRLQKFCRQIQVLQNLQEPFDQVTDETLWHPQLAATKPSKLFMTLLDYSKDKSLNPRCYRRRQAFI
ncbi:unnamed protein product [Effrenium voratum]|uniref:Uncharacterized protein n=1 Tax=Effrenium voratum TaxID=2562239 RepID=A0AA36J8S2_9DINO|nr:unnamed protein product [Effrenium voratum]CAJ1455093.1 unnamed protein product [Effrenium voratum]